MNSCIWAGAPVSLEFLAEVIDRIAHPIFVKDRQFRWVLLNAAFAELSGYPREQMLGKSDGDFFPKEQADFFRSKDVEMFATGQTVVIDEESITAASGKKHTLATSKVPLRDASGEVTHLIGIIHDISRIKEVESALQRANDDLEARVAARTAALVGAQSDLVRHERLAVMGRLAGGLAHQIRNPLGAITNAAYVLQRLTTSAPQGDLRKAVEIVHEEAWRANRIITDLLDYARVRAASQESTDIGALLDDVLEAQAVPASIAVTKRIPDLPRATIDPQQVRGALTNLVRNAVEAMPGGGTLSVEADREGDELVIVLRDSGPGIAPEVRSRLFEPLVTTKATGLGLGLTTARSLIENQGGALTGDSAPGEGTTARIRLPIE